MNAIKLVHDGDGGTYYTLEDRRIKDKDIILLNDTELHAAIHRTSKGCRAHNDSWTAHDDNLQLMFKLNDILCCVHPSEFGKQRYQFKG